MISTPFTALVGCAHPIQQATMGGVSGRQLAAAVANAGGLGMLHSFGPLEFGGRLDWMDEHTSGVWGVGFNGLGLDRNMALFELAIERAALVEVSFIDPRPDLVDQAHAGGKLCFWQVGSLDCVRMAMDAGVDVIVVQGTEAGGHHAGREELRSVLEPALGIADRPIVAAGGISNGRSLASVIAAGAAGARVGTAFVVSRESDASDDYRDALVAASAADTTVTEAFGAEWPDWPHRVLRTSVEAATEAIDDPIGFYDDGTNRFELPRFSTMAPTSYSTGPHEAMAMYAGTGVEFIETVSDAGRIVDSMVVEAESALAEMRENPSGSSLGSQ